MLTERTQNITYHDGFLPFKENEIPKDLRAGDMFSSLLKVYGKELDQKLIDLFNLSFIGEGVKKEALYMGKADLKKEHHLIELKEALSKATPSRSFLQKLGLSTLYYKMPQHYVETSIKSQENLLGYKLSFQQKEAIKHLTGEPQYTSLEGKAGSGKTTVLRSVAASYRAAGYRVIGTSFQGAAVGTLYQVLGEKIEGAYTLDKLVKAWQLLDQKTPSGGINPGSINPEGVKSGNYASTQLIKRYELTSNTVIIVDEAGMAPSRLMMPLLERALQKGAKVIMVGDPYQLGAIERGSYSKLLMKGSFVLDEIRRQENPQDKIASLKLSEGRIKEVLDHYKGKTTVLETPFGAKLNLSLQVAQHIQKASSHLSPLDHMVMAFRNQDVKDLNHLIQGALLRQGVLGKEPITIFQGFDKLSLRESNILLEAVGVKSLKANTRLSYAQALTLYGASQNDATLCPLFEKHLKPLTLYKGDKVLFTKNRRFLATPQKEGARVLNPLKRVEQHQNTLNLYNGNVAIIEAYDSNSHMLTLSREEGDKILLSLEDTSHLDLGYAITINKSQGKTAKHTHLYLENTNRAKLSHNLIYVGLTRHKESVHLYTSRSYLKDQSLETKIKSNMSLTYQDVVGCKPTLKDHFDNKDAGVGQRNRQEAAQQDSSSNPSMRLMQDLYQTVSMTRTRWQEIQKDVRAGEYELKNHPQMEDFKVLKNKRTLLAKKVLKAITKYQSYLSSVHYTEHTLLKWAGKEKYIPSPTEIKMDEYQKAAKEASLLWKNISRSGGQFKNHAAYNTFQEIRHLRNKVAYELTAFGMPSHNGKGQNNSFVLDKKTTERLRAHTKQYIGSKVKETILNSHNQINKNNPVRQKTFNQGIAHHKATPSYDFKDILQEKGIDALKDAFKAINTEKHQAPSKEIKEKFMATVQKNCTYLDKGWQDMRWLNKDFGVTTPDGTLYKTRSEYLAAVGQDKASQHLIDYTTPLGQEIKQEVKYIHDKTRGRGVEK